VITFFSPEAVIMTSEDFAPQRGAMHKSIVSNVIFHPQSHTSAGISAAYELLLTAHQFAALHT
jgi:hypothetical protein